MPEQHIVYLAAPYTSDQPSLPDTRETAANLVAGHLIEAGHIVFSPLSYSSTFKNAGFTFPQTELWYRFDCEFLNISDELVVLQLPGWQDSVGVSVEIDRAHQMGIPVHYNKPGPAIACPPHAGKARHDVKLEPPRPVTYLAAPYAHPDARQIKQRVDSATRHTAGMMSEGHIVFSPITYTEIIQDLGFGPNQDYDWYEFDLAFLRRCQELHVLQLPGWQDSHGVSLEIATAREMGIPIRYVESG